MDDLQKGFALIELLVVIVILAVLAAIAIPAYGRFFGPGEAEENSRYIGQGEAEANAGELSMVQNAMDGMMANNLLESVSKSPLGGTNIFDRLPKGPGAEALAKPDGFLRSGGTPDNPTKCTYTWTTTGRVTQVSCP